ncbi:uncharacterized protein RHO25_010938 [Cercospora beticola]|uniref:Ig-like domain-containing protein n=1 Tax=Cercospora beticola TaxID=122368 RepID=A0ABZ0P3A0_CERBT|nr:hypothetical protein RHO25_010938 [Cercospora beticola]CAK1366169.1 unnamed protein product [Cercospora beticola]
MKLTSTLTLTALAVTQVYAAPDPLRTTRRRTGADSDPTTAPTQTSSRKTSSSKSSTTAPPQVTGLYVLDENRALTGFDASLLCADSDDTTFVLGCARTSAPNSLCSLLTSVSITVTANPTGYQALYTTRQNGGSGTVTQTCNFNGPTASPSAAATCFESAWIAVGGSTSQIRSTTSTYATESFPPVATFSLTAGRDNAGAETCAARPTGNGGAGAQASPESNDAGSMAVGKVKEVYKVLVPVGMAAVALAGL